jgi:hypothetical protein
VLVVPADISNAAAHDEPPYAVHVRRPLIRPSDADLDEIAAVLNRSKSKKITIYAGAGCAGAHDEVVATAARLKAPIAHTSRGKDFLGYDNPYNVGMTGMIGGSAGYHANLDCDVLLLLGADFAWTQFYPDGATILQVDTDPTHIGRRHPVTIGAVGDIKATLEALLPRLLQHEDNAFLRDHVERHREDVETANAETVSGPDAVISGTYLTKIINKHAADDALFAADDGTPLVWMLRHIETGGKHRTFRSLLHGTMADGMPSALGLQKCPGPTSDLSRRRWWVLHAAWRSFDDSPGEPAHQDRLYDNGKLGFIDIEQKAAGLVPVFTDLKTPNFGDFARAMGLWGHMVSKAGELEDAVRAWLAQPGPAVLDVKVKPMQLVTLPSPFVSPEAVVGWRSIAPRQCSTAKATTSGKCWWRTSLDPTGSSVGSGRDALIARTTAPTGRVESRSPKTSARIFLKQRNSNMTTSAAAAPIAATSPSANHSVKQLPTPNSDFYDLYETLDAEELATVKRVRAFMESKVAPVITKYWVEDAFPFELVPAVKELGIGGLAMHGYGCAGGSLALLGFVQMELARVDLSFSTFIGVHVGLAMGSIYINGSEEQKQKWLPPMARFEKIGCFGLTEPLVGFRVDNPPEAPPDRTSRRLMLERGGIVEPSKGNTPLTARHVAPFMQSRTDGPVKAPQRARQR